MPQSQSGSFKAPENRAQLQALIAQRDELQGQLRALEERRFALAETHSRVDPTMRVEVERRVKTLDVTIDRVAKQIEESNSHITAGQARFSAPSVDWSAPGMPVPPALPATVDVPPPGFPAGEPGLGMERVLLLEGAGILLLGALAWVWGVRRLERKFSGRAGTDPGQMTHLQQSVDAIALEVERISENQRWVTKVINEKAIGGGEAQPVPVGAKAEKVR
ncbi:MAG: hypothetical protein ACRENU_04655 [Gemmatimonadaceae bacterium]